MIENAFQRAAISTGAWWAIVPPGALVAVIILSCSLLGGAIEDALNPRLRVAHLSARTFRLRTLVGRGSEARVSRLLEVEDLNVWFDLEGGRELHAVQGVSFDARARRAARPRRRVRLRQDHDVLAFSACCRRARASPAASC